MLKAQARVLADQVVAGRLQGRLRQRPRAVGRCGSGGATASIDLLSSTDSVTLWCDSDRSPQDTWYAVEDLWLRLARCMPMSTRTEGAGGCVVSFDLRHAADEEALRLHSVALEASTYAWQLDGRCGSFVHSIAVEGGALLIAVTSIPTIVRWPQGDDLGWQVTGFFARLRALQGDRRSEVPS